jgi:hypothetical protein
MSIVSLLGKYLECYILENRGELLTYNVGLLDHIYSLIEEVSTFYTAFILEEFAYTWEGCRKERLYSALRREMEVWLLHAKSPIN